MAGAAAGLTAGWRTDRLYMVLVGASFALGALGLVEDLRGVRPRTRFLTQGVVGGAAAPFLLDGTRQAVVVRVLLALLAIVWVASEVNAVNFMDGINGISCAQMIAAGGCWAAVGILDDHRVLAIGGLALAGAAFGFLPFNFPSARIFLGDSGSYFAGGWLALLGMVGLRLGMSVVVMAAPLCIYLADTSATLVRRALRHERLSEPHRDHVYQRLVIGGWSHARTTQTIGALMMAQGGLGIMVRHASAPSQALGAMAIAGTCAGYLLLPSIQTRTTRR